MKTKLHTYQFNLGVIPQHQEYLKLRDQMEAQSRRRNPLQFVNAPGGHVGRYFGHLNKLSEGERVATYEVELDTACLFDDQWNTVTTEEHTGYRVFDWTESYESYNNNLIHGHWLEVTDEMVTARDTTLACGYCGGHYGSLHEDHLPIPTEGPRFCTQCLGSPYLKEDELVLLRLMPESFAGRRGDMPLTEEEAAWLKPRYVELQLRGQEARRKERAEQQRGKVVEQRRLDDMKFDGMTRLLDAGIDLENVIFHDHRPAFKFGWRSPLSPSVASAMQEKLKEIDFSYPTEFVTTAGKK